MACQVDLQAWVVAENVMAGGAWNAHPDFSPSSSARVIGDFHIVQFRYEDSGSYRPFCCAPGMARQVYGSVDPSEVVLNPPST